MSEDRALISATRHYNVVGRGPCDTICFENCFCKAEICFERILETIQATIFGVRVVKGGSGSFEHGCRVTCLSPSCSDKLIDGKFTSVTNAQSPEFVLLDSHRRGMLKGSDGYIDLARQVVSVELQGSMKVVVQTYSPSGDIAAQGHVSFTPETCSISRRRFYVGNTQVEINVAWSLLVSEKRDIALQGWVYEASEAMNLRRSA